MADANPFEALMSKLAYFDYDPKRYTPADKEVAALEKAVGGKLPADYRAFVLRFGRTGFENYASFPVREQPCPLGKRVYVKQFLGFSKDSMKNITDIYTDTYAEQIPPGTLPIALDPNGNIVLLTVTSPGQGKVWVWDHEYRDLAPRLDEIRSAVQSKGVNVQKLDDYTLYSEWERLFPEKLKKPAGYQNVYAVANSFTEFIRLLRPDE